MDARKIWEIACQQLELQLDRASYNTWLRDATFLGVEEERTYVIGVRNTYVRDMLQYRLYRNVWQVVCDVRGDEAIQLRFEVYVPPKKDPESDGGMPLFRLLAEQSLSEEGLSLGDEDFFRPTYTEETPLHQHVGRPALDPLPESELNSRFTFERFIVNASNRVTYEAARAVSEHPARAYNPFLIYGGVGLGKTHLLQSIAHACQQRGLRVIYIPSEAFTNDLIQSIRHKTMAMFREKYRSADVLLVDDIQFIGGKDSTQEEFFHTFNALSTFNKQIVLASDRHPRELTTLEDRLRSRFEGGLVSDVQPLEYESRLAILEMWTRERDLRLEPSVMEMVATRAKSNVRELEGIFNQIIAKAQLGSGRLTLEGAETTLERYERPRHHNIGSAVTIKRIIEVTAKHFQMTAKDLTGKRRTARVNQARQVAMYLSREMTDASLPQIGECFGGRSHTTVLHGCNKITDEVDYDSGLRGRIEAIYDELMA